MRGLRFQPATYTQSTLPPDTIAAASITEKTLTKISTEVPVHDNGHTLQSEPCLSTGSPGMLRLIRAYDNEVPVVALLEKWYKQSFLPYQKTPQYVDASV